MIQENNKIVMFPFRDKTVIDIILKYVDNEGKYSFEEKLDTKHYPSLNLSKLIELKPASFRSDSIQPQVRSLQTVSYPSNSQPTRVWLENSTWDSYAILKEQGDYWRNKLNSFMEDVCDTYVNQILNYYKRQLELFFKEDSYLLRLGSFNDLSTEDHFWVLQNPKNIKKYEYFEVDFTLEKQDKQTVEVQIDQYSQAYKTTYKGRKLKPQNKSVLYTKEEIIDFILRNSELITKAFLNPNIEDLQSYWKTFASTTKDRTKVKFEYLEVFNKQTKEINYND